MRVRAAEAEGIDARDPPPVDRRPPAAIGHDLHVERVPAHLVARDVEVQLGRNLAVHQSENDLEQSGDAAGRLGVAQVRLHRPDHQRAVRPVRAVHHAECLGFDRIAERRTRSLRFDVTDRARIDRRRGEDRAHERLLRLTVRHGQSRARAVVIDARAEDDRHDPVAVGLRLREPLEHDDAAALAAHVTVGAGSERLAPAVRGEHADLRSRDQRIGQRENVDAAGDGQRTLALTQAAARAVDRDERRRAGGVDRHARALQTERVRDTSGDDAGDRALQVVRPDLVELEDAAPELRVLVRARADEHARRRVAQ